MATSGHEGAASAFAVLAISIVINVLLYSTAGLAIVLLIRGANSVIQRQ